MPFMLLSKYKSVNIVEFKKKKWKFVNTYVKLYVFLINFNVTYL